MSTGQHTDYINLYGGIDVLLNRLTKTKVGSIISQHLGDRHYRAVYSYTDAIVTKALAMVAGLARIENTVHLRQAFKNHPLFGKGMSPDAISKALKELAVGNSYYQVRDSNAIGKNHEVNENTALNTLILDLAIELKLLVPGQEYVLDIDATIIETKVSDARPHYKFTGTGYAPLAVIYGGIPIYIESRNGNTPASYRITEVLQNSIGLLHSKGLKVKFVRSDAAGSNDKVIGYLQKEGFLYYIRGTKNKLSYEQEELMIWEQSEENERIQYALDRVYINGRPSKWINYKIQKYKGEENPKAFGIMTSDFNSGPETIIEIYNRRGDQENRFADLKEMGWHYMTHHELKFNTVHLHMTMIAYLFFLFGKKYASSVTNFVRETFKPRTFVEKFVKVATRWVGDRLDFFHKNKEYSLVRGPT